MALAPNAFPEGAPVPAPRPGRAGLSYARGARARASIGRALAGASLVVSSLAAPGASSPAAGLPRALRTPLVVRCGQARAGAAGEDSWGVVSSDAPFSGERSWGHVGGKAGRLDGGGVIGGEEGWPVTWREGEVKYIFRLERGRYRVLLGFVEVEVAADGLRVFDVVAEGRDVISELDVHAEAGDFAWLTRSFEVWVDDGWLDLSFVARTGDRPPRVSRIGVLRAEDGASSAGPEPPPLAGRGGLAENLLWWDPLPAARANGYRLLRSAGPEGPFEILSPALLRTARFADATASAAVAAWYRLQARGLGGQWGEPSAALRLTAREPSLPGIASYRIIVEPSDWRRAAVRSPEPIRVPGEIDLYGNRYPVDLFLETSERAWRARKTLHVDMSRDRYRPFHKRREIVFSAEADDFTQLRERLSSLAARRVGLAAPRVDPAWLWLGGRPWGFRYDVERLGKAFRKRAGLDRGGPLIRWTEGDRGWRSWQPRGRLVGEKGSALALTWLLDRLRWLGEGEIEPFFRRSLYLDRWVTRLALGAARGELDAGPESWYLLRDSRNGKWELFRQRHDHSDWGVRGGATEVSSPGPEELDRILFPLSRRIGRPARGPWSVLLTRFFHSAPIRAAYLDRLERMLREELDVDSLRALVAESFEPVRAALEVEPRLWPDDHGAALASAPEKIVAAHAARRGALLERIAAERKRAPEPVVIAEFLLEPREGEPWVEVVQRGSEPVDLSRYRFSRSLERAEGRVFGRGRLSPGKRVRIALRPTARDEGEAGAPLVLWRRDPKAGFRLADFAFPGAPTAGFACRRIDLDAEPSDPDAGAVWVFRREGDPSSPPPDFAPRRPSYRMLSGITPAKSGGFHLWLQFPGEPRPQDSLARVVARISDPAEKGVREVELTWRDEAYRFEAAAGGVEPSGSGDDRTAFWFVARSRSGLERRHPLGAPARTFFFPQLRPLEINEVCPRPRREPGAPGEFVEIANRGDRPLSLRGLHLSDSRRLPTKWRIDEEIVLPAGGYAILWADGLDRGRHASFRLANSGEYLGLYGPVEEGSLVIDAVAFRGVPTGSSWGRREDGTRGFRVWEDPTPGKKNMPRIPQKYLQKHRKDGER